MATRPRNKVSSLLQKPEVKTSKQESKKLPSLLRKPEEKPVQQQGRKIPSLLRKPETKPVQQESKKIPALLRKSEEKSPSTPQQKTQPSVQRPAEKLQVGRAIRVGGIRGGILGASLVAGAAMEKSSQESKLKQVAERESFKDVMNRPESAPKQAAKKVSMSDIPKAAPAPAPKAKATAAPAPKMQERGVREGPNENIGDDTRARAMASVAELEDVNKKNKWKGTM